MIKSGRASSKRSKKGKANASQHPKYTPGVFSPAGLSGKYSKKSSSKAHAMYNSAMKHSV